MALEIQWKYQNNKVVREGGYIKSEIRPDDCLKDGATYYTCTVPEGVVVKDFMAYLEGEASATAEIDISIGSNDCVFCESKGLALKVGEATCKDTCKCKITDKDYLVKITVVKAPTDANIVIFLGVFDPGAVICDVKPIKLCTDTVIVEPCTGADDSCGCAKGC